MMRVLLIFALLLSASSWGASLLTIVKTPAEARNAGVNFLVASADGISLVSVKATDLVTGADVTSSLIAASPAPIAATSVTVNGVTQTGQFVVFRLQNGTNNQRVLVDVLVTDNVTGETFDGQLTVLIQAGALH